VCTENNFTQILDANLPIEDTDSGVTASSISNNGQPSVLSQQIKSLQNDNAMKIQQIAKIPIDIMQSKLSSQSQQSSNTSPNIIDQGTGDLSALEKVEKLKAQYFELYQ
jgi:hypothetical protein